MTYYAAPDREDDLTRLICAKMKDIHMKDTYSK